MYELNAERNILQILDMRTGKNVDFILKCVDSDDHIKYKSEWMDKLMKSKNTEEMLNHKLSWGEKVILGVSEGYFFFNKKQISSNKKSKHYNPAWYTLIRSKRADLILKIIDHVFGEQHIIIKEETRPFVQN